MSFSRLELEKLLINSISGVEIKSFPIFRNKKNMLITLGLILEYNLFISLDCGHPTASGVQINVNSLIQIVLVIKDIIRTLQAVEGIETVLST